MININLKFSLEIVFENSNGGTTLSQSNINGTTQGGHHYWFDFIILRPI